MPYSILTVNRSYGQVCHPWSGELFLRIKGYDDDEHNSEFWVKTIVEARYVCHEITRIHRHLECLIKDVENGSLIDVIPAPWWFRQE